MVHFWLSINKIETSWTWELCYVILACNIQILAQSQMFLHWWIFVGFSPITEIQRNMTNPKNIQLFTQFVSKYFSKSLIDIGGRSWHNLKCTNPFWNRKNLIIRHIKIHQESFPLPTLHEIIKNISMKIQLIDGNPASRKCEYCFPFGIILLIVI